MGLTTGYGSSTESKAAPPYSGLWGLGYGSAAITALLDDNNVTPIISLYFNPGADTASASAAAPSGAGYLTLGGWDPKFAAEELQWVPLRSHGSESWWKVPMAGVQLGSKKFSMCDDGCPFMIDSGMLRHL